MGGPWQHAGEWMTWLLRASLQASVLIGLVLAAQGLLGRRGSARWRHALWLLVWVRLVLPAAPGASWSLSNLTEAALAHLGAAHGDAAPGSAATGTGEPVTVRAGRLPLGGFAPAPAAQVPRHHAGGAWRPQLVGALMILWGAGAAALLLRLLACNVRFHRRLRRSSRRPPRELLSVLASCRAEMHVRRRVEAVETDAVRTPALFGLLRTRLLLPPGLGEALTEPQLRHVLRHELAHVKRGDAAIDWLAAVLAAVHWFNPLVWLALRRMRSDREPACDETVLARRGARDARAYGQTVLELLASPARRARPAGVIGVAEDTRQIRRRIQMIASFRPASRWRGILGTAVMLLLAAAALTNARCDSPQGTLPHGFTVGAMRGALPPAPAPAEDDTTLTTRLYDVVDLLTSPAETRPAAGGAAGRRRLAKLVAAAREAAGEEAWRPAGPGILTTHDGQVIVTQTAAGHRKVARALWNLRRSARLQILIDARFVASRAKVFDAIGARWQGLDPPGREFKLPAEPKRSPAEGRAVGTAESAVRRPLAVRWAMLTDEQVGRLVAQAKRDKQVRVLSSPRVIVLNGEPATITVGSEIPYITDYAARRDKEGKTTYEPIVKHSMVGMELTVRVTLPPDRRYMTLLAQPALSRVVGVERPPYRAPDGTDTGLKLALPTIETRQVCTTVRVRDGATFALRGLPDWGQADAARRGDETLLLIKPRVVSSEEKGKAAF